MSQLGWKGGAMSTSFRSHVTTALVAAVTSLMVAGGPALARTTGSLMRTDADTVNGFGAVGCHATIANRSGNLVATCTDTGRLPNNIIAKAPDSALLDGKDSTAFLGVGGTAANSDQLDGQDSSAFLGVGAKAADSDLLDGIDSSGFLGAGAKAADANTLDGIDSLGFARSLIYVRTMSTNGSANASGTCPEGDLCFAGGYYCDT